MKKATIKKVLPKIQRSGEVVEFKKRINNNNLETHLTFKIKEQYTERLLESDLNTPKLTEYFKNLGATEVIDVEPDNKDRWSAYLVSYIFHKNYDLNRFFKTIPKSLKDCKLCIFRAEKLREKEEAPGARQRFMGVGLEYKIDGEKYRAPIPNTFKSFHNNVANKEYVDLFMKALVEESSQSEIIINLMLKTKITTKEQHDIIQEAVNVRYTKPLGLANGGDVSLTGYSIKPGYEIENLLDLYLYLSAAMKNPKKLEFDYKYINISTDAKKTKLMGIKGDGEMKVKFYQFVFASRLVGVFEKFLETKYGSDTKVPFYGFYNR